jgi:Tfp pilus assembly PilM family ATPase
MARKVSSILGIDLNDSEIRIIQVKFKNGEPYVNRAGFTSMPATAFSEGMVQDAGILAVALRRLIDTMGAGETERAAFSLNSERVSVRIISVPPVPDSELPAMIAAEIDHRGETFEKGAAQAYLRLSAALPGGDEEAIRVIVMAVESEVTQGIREVAERAGLAIVALEPSRLAKVRTFCLDYPAPTAFLLLVGRQTTGAAFFVNGFVVSYRRLDIGTHALTQAIQMTPGVEGVLDPYAFGVPQGLGADQEYLNREAADRLALEARRTIDYLEREYPSLPPIDRIHLTVEGVEFAVLAKILGDRMERQVELVRPLAREMDSVEAATAFSGEAGLRYAAGFGLAMIESPLTSAQLPRVDFFSENRSAARKEVTKRNFAGAILVSVLAIFVGLAGSVLYSKQTDQIKRETAISSALSADLRAATDQTVADRLQRTQQYDALRKEGMPLDVIMDYVASSVEPGVGLKSVTVDPNLKVVIIGEALDETSMIKTSQNLQHSPVLMNLMVNTFSRGDALDGSLLSFTLTADTVSADRIKSPSPVKVIR